MLKYALKNRYIKDNFIMITGTLLGGLLGYLYHFVVSRQMSVAQYGELQSLLSIFLIFGVFNSALSFFVIKHTSVFAVHGDRTANVEFLDYLMPRVLKYAALFFFLLIVTSPALAKLLHFSSLIGFLVISLATFFSMVAVIYGEVLRGWKLFFLISIIGIAVAFTKFASGALLVIFFHKTSIVSFSILLPSFVGWFLTRHWSRKKITSKGTIKGEQAGWKDKYFSETNIRKSAVSIFFFSLALIFVSNFDVILVKYFSSSETAGHYGAFALLGKIILWLNLAVVAVMLPGACADGYSGKRPDKKNLLNSYGLMAVIGLGIILIYFLVPNFIINLFFGKKYVFDTQILWLFGLMSFLLSILTFEANLSFAKHDFRVVYFLAATVLAMVAGVAKYHANLEQIVLTFSISFLLGYLFVTALNLSHEKRRPRAKNQ